MSIILITGVSSGFGKETARLLSEAGHKVYGTIREEQPADLNINFLKMDLTDTGSIDRAVEEVLNKEGRIDILINNAGMHSGGPAETIPFEFIKLQMETNFTGMVYLTRKVLPAMRNQGGARIINFSSIGGLMGLPFQAFYSASKFAIEGFSEALRMEVKQFNIKVILINPGDFCTSNSANRRKFLAPADLSDPYYNQFGKTLKIIEKDEAGGGHPEKLARKLVRIAVCKNPAHRYVISSFDQKLAVVLKCLLPSRLFSRILESHYGIG